MSETLPNILPMRVTAEACVQFIMMRLAGRVAPHDWKLLEQMIRSYGHACVAEALGEDNGLTLRMQNTELFIGPISGGENSNREAAKDIAK